MKSKEMRIIVKMFLFSLLMYGIHKLFFFLFLANSLEQRFIYSLELLYVFFFLSSMGICSFLFYINKKNINNTGFTFLLLTVAKMGIVFYFVQPILKVKAIHQPTEKMSFFAIFILFLAIETFVTIRILNNKQ